MLFVQIYSNCIKAREIKQKRRLASVQLLYYGSWLKTSHATNYLHSFKNCHQEIKIIILFYLINVYNHE